MKKRLGFTLVELLGVIVILAILSLITIPIISNVVNDMRIKSLESSAYGLIEASQLYYAQNGSNNIRFDIKNNDISSTDTDNLLKYKGSIKEGTIILDKKGKVIVCITDGKNSAYKNYNETKVTTSKGKICSIKENSSIVYLDDEPTIKEYDNAKLTELVNELKEENEIIKSRLSTNETSIGTNNSLIASLSSELSETKSSMLSLNDVYPIGSIYITTTEDTVVKVQNKLGGTWEQIEDRFLLGAGSTYLANTTGGSSDAVVVSHAHTGTTDSAGAHTHNAWTAFRGSCGANDAYLDGSACGSSAIERGGRISSAGNHYHTFTTSYVGVDGTGKNMPPYITVYMYKRTA